MNYNLEEMTPKDIENLIEFLKSLLSRKKSEKNTLSKVITEECGKAECPACNSSIVIKDGKDRNKNQRYKCKICKKRYVSTSNTIFMNSKVSFQEWKSLFECMDSKLSIRKTAAKLGVNKNTAFAMRHKVLNMLGNFRKNVKLSGTIQADETTIPINFKGLNATQMPRHSKKRKSASKILNHKVCMLGAIDEYVNQYLEIVDYGEITSEDVEKSLGHRLENPSILVTDCRSSYESFAHNHSLILEQVKSKTYKNDNGYTLSDINELHSDFYHFINFFKGISLKHLQGYIDWFVYQKFLNYTVELMKQSEEMMYYCFKQKGYIKIEDIFNMAYPFEINDAYKDYIATPQI